MDLSSFLDSQFITDYIVNSDLGIVKDRVIREGCDIYKETTAESSESTKSLEGDKDEDDDDDTVRSSVKLLSWLKASRQTSSTEAVSLEEKVKREIDAYEKLYTSSR